MLGVKPKLGRVFLPEEEQPGRDNVTLLSHGLWRRRFGADPTLIGRKLVINGRSFQVVGVLPPDFQYAADLDLWTPLAFSNDDLSPSHRGSHGMEVLARITPELSFARARADMDAVARRMMELHPEYPYKQYEFGLIVTPLLEEMVGDIKTALWILMGAVGLVLLIACANVANLLLARASAREREIAIRTAIGAGRLRLVRQLLTESVILGIAGGTAGLLLAQWGLRVLTNISAASFPRLADAHMDGWVLAFTMAISIGTGMLFGLAPAFQISGVTHESLKEGGRGSSAGRASQGLRRALAACGILKPDLSLPKPKHQAILVKPTRVLRPSRGGLLLPTVDHTRIGTLVEESTLLGTLVDPVTFEVLEEFRAPYRQTALLLLRPTMARLEGGAMTYVVSEPA